MKRDQESSGTEAKAEPRSVQGKGAAFTTPSRSHQLANLQRSAGNRAVAARLGGETTPVQRLADPLVVQRTLEEELRDQLKGVSDEDLVRTLVLMMANSGLDTTAAAYARTGSGSGGKLMPDGTTPLPKDKSVTKLPKTGTDSSLMTDAQMDAQIKSLEKQITDATSGKSNKAQQLETLKKRLANVKKRQELDLKAKGVTTNEDKETKELADREAKMDAAEKAKARKKEIEDLQRKLDGATVLTKEEAEQASEEEQLADLKERLKEKDKAAETKKSREKEIHELENPDEEDLAEQARLEFLRSKKKQKMDAMAFDLQSQDTSKGIVDVMQNPALREQAIKNNPLLEKWAKLKKKPEA